MKKENENMVLGNLNTYQKPNDHISCFLFKNKLFLNFISHMCYFIINVLDDLPTRQNDYLVLVNRTRTLHAVFLILENCAELKEADYQI
jgi:hypothetical protein